MPRFAICKRVFQRSMIVAMAASFGWAAMLGSADAQMIHSGTQLHGTSNSFFEQFGVGFGLQGPNWFLQQNSAGQALPPFGGFSPAASATTGVSFQGHGVSGYLNVSAGQGSQTTSTVQAPSVTFPNGFSGGFFDTTQTPFVTSVVPVVGDGGNSPVAERMARLKAEAGLPSRGGSAHRPAAGAAAAKSSAVNSAASQATGSATASGGVTGAVDQLPVMSVAEIKAMRASQATVPDTELNDLIAKAETAAQAGKSAVARIYYEQAARRATGPTQKQLQAKAAALGK